MQTVHFSVPDLQNEGEATDLGTVLTGLSGVAGVQLDPVAHAVSVEFDPAYVDGEGIARSIRRSGYTIAPGA